MWLCCLITQIGAFIEHVQRLKELDTQGILEIVEVKEKEHLNDLDGLILPGGESTSIVLIAERSGMLGALQQFVQNPKKAVWGTCAGLILLSNNLEGQKKGGQKILGGLDVTCSRNYFGRQKDSFVTELPFLPHHPTPSTIPVGGEKENAQGGAPTPKRFEAVFIRAPAILSVDNPKEVEVLAELPLDTEEQKKNLVVAVRQGRLMGTAFHPELTNDTFWHQYFVDLVKDTKNKAT